MSTRVGGVSQGPFARLNLGALTEDDPAAVKDNRERLRRAAALPGEPSWLRQVHGRRIVALDEMPAGGSPPEADGGWSAAGAVCAVLAADCMPVLLARRDGGAVAAVHAGWRGLAAGVLETALAAVPGASQDWLAWLGPRIGPAHFLVREDVLAAFPDAVFAFREAGDGQWHADLAAIAARRLGAHGVAVHDSGLCTAADAQRFFSHRRDGRCGRMAALIWRRRDAG
ncbi:peptidoglycan editing factor PgeF [Algiphilus aromaticivorans]|jgi:hypothetical protein|uniref:peptidoglycan editing factor PgeF n=1 Tax=Algiphilus aromaticivorans TaxID=382454 RepID=UPI000A49D6B6|nr:peptidoglycan editing factor PgeF [Algiphilus aromaticivorans]